MSTKTTKTTKSTARKEATMKKLPSIETIKNLSGSALEDAYEVLLGEKPKPRTPVPTLRKRIIAELERRAAESAPTVDTYAAAAAITVAAAAAVTEDPDAQIEAVHEAALRACRDAVERGADPKTCSDAVGEYAAGAIDEVEFNGRLERAEAAGLVVEAPVVEPAVLAAEASTDAPVANADAPKSATPEADAQDRLLARARSMAPAAQRAFFESLDKRDLLLLVERATGAKTSGRLGPKAAIERLLAALAPQSEAKPEATPARAARGRAAELPPVGTVLRNVDRHGAVRASCTIVEGGVEYAGAKYTSLSAAAIAASRDLGNATKQTSGPRFWGLVDAKPKAAKGLDLDVIGRAWDRYRERVEAAAKDSAQEDKAKLHTLLAGHSTALATLSATVA